MRRRRCRAPCRWWPGAPVSTWRRSICVTMPSAPGWRLWSGQSCRPAAAPARSHPDRTGRSPRVHRGDLLADLAVAGGARRRIMRRSWCSIPRCWPISPTRLRATISRWLCAGWAQCGSATRPGRVSGHRRPRAPPSTDRRLPARRGRRSGRLDAAARRMDRVVRTRGRHGMTGADVRLDGKAALVTGASGGIGAAVARALHAQGASWYCPARGETHSTRWRRNSASGRRVSRRPARPGGAGRAGRRRGTGGRTAGDPGEQRRLHPRHAGAADEGRDWQAVLDVDLTAPFRLARAALRGMLRRRAGES